MNLIFHNGEKLYNKEFKAINNPSELLESRGIRLNHYQKQLIEQLVAQNQRDYAIFGDDFKIEITPMNVNRNCAFRLVDYDENQKYENDICIDFTKEELDQFISLLQTVRNKM